MAVVLATGAIIGFLSQREAQAAVVYEPPLEAGPDPFTSPVDVSAASVGAVIPTPTPEPTPTTQVSPTATPSSPATASPDPTATGQASPPGTTGPSPIPPGNFGGTGFTTVCDRAQLVQQLAANPAAMAAWGNVHGLTPDQVPGYIRTLRPSTLTQDTRLTNHSFKGGQAVPFQSIQVAGTAVLVDDAGRVVARCRCGNPLLEPEPVQGNCKGCPKGYQVPALLARTKVPRVVVAVNPPEPLAAGAPLPTPTASAQPSTPAPTTGGGGALVGNVAGRWVFTTGSKISGPEECEGSSTDEVLIIEQDGSSLTFRDPDSSTSERLTGTLRPDGSFEVSFSDSEGGESYTIVVAGRFQGNKIVEGRAELSSTNSTYNCSWSYTATKGDK